MTTEEELQNVKQVLGTLITWLVRDLGANNVEDLLNQLNPSEPKNPKSPCLKCGEMGETLETCVKCGELVTPY